MAPAKPYVPTGRPRGRPPKGRRRVLFTKPTSRKAGPKVTAELSTQDEVDDELSSALQIENAIDVLPSPSTTSTLQVTAMQLNGHPPDFSLKKRGRGRPPKVKKTASTGVGFQGSSHTAPPSQLLASIAVLPTPTTSKKAQVEETSLEPGEKRPRGRPRKRKYTTSTLPTLFVVPAKRSMNDDFDTNNRSGATTTRHSVTEAKEKKDAAKEERRAAARERLRSSAALDTTLGGKLDVKPVSENLQPVKRGPGRPRKHPYTEPERASRSTNRETMTDFSHSKTAAADDVTAMPPRIKRGPGRPRKDQTMGSTSTTGVSVKLGPRFATQKSSEVETDRLDAMEQEDDPEAVIDVVGGDVIDGRSHNNSSCAEAFTDPQAEGREGTIDLDLKSSASRPLALEQGYPVVDLNLDLAGYTTKPKFKFTVDPKPRSEHWSQDGVLDMPGGSSFDYEFATLHNHDYLSPADNPGQQSLTRTKQSTSSGCKAKHKQKQPSVEGDHPQPDSQDRSDVLSKELRSTGRQHEPKEISYRRSSTGAGHGASEEAGEEVHTTSAAGRKNIDKASTPIGEISPTAMMADSGGEADAEDSDGEQ